MDFELLDSIVTKSHPLHNKVLIEEKYGELVELEREEVRILTFNMFMRPPLVKNNVCLKSDKT